MKSGEGKRKLNITRLKIRPVITSVCTTVVLCAAGVAFIINKISNQPENEPVRVYYNTTTRISDTSVNDSQKPMEKKASLTSAPVKTVKPESTAKTTASTFETVHSQTSPTTEVSYVFPADVNTVSAEQLTAIDGIGEITAQKIIDFRRNAGKIYNMELLLQIDGIGKSKLELLKQYLYVSQSDYSETSVLTKKPETTASTKTTTVSQITSVTKPKTSETTVCTTAKSMKSVNINTATAEELADCLLIDLELAEAIVELRTNIQYFVNDLELLYVDGFSEKMLVERRPFILL